MLSYAYKYWPGNCRMSLQVSSGTAVAAYAAVSAACLFCQLDSVLTEAVASGASHPLNIALQRYPSSPIEPSGTSGQSFLEITTAHSPGEVGNVYCITETSRRSLSLTGQQHRRSKKGKHEVHSVSFEPGSLSFSSEVDLLLRGWTVTGRLPRDPTADPQAHSMGH